MMRKPGAVSDVRNIWAIVQAGLLLLGAGAAEVLADNVEVDGVIANGTPQWVVAGNPAANVPVKPGDTIVWKALSGKHGVVFNTQGVAEAFLSFQTGSSLPALGTQTVMGEVVWGTAPQAAVGAGTLLAQATVKPGLAAGTTLGFFCSQHGRAMSGSLLIPSLIPPPPTKSPPTTSPPATSTDNSPRDPGGLDDPRIKRVVRAEVVALDQAFLCNRLGAAMPQGMIFALKRDVVNNTDPKGPLDAGCVTLRPGKRARPIVLRANLGDCLEITFTNLLCPSPKVFHPPLEQPATREAGVHVAGLELVGSINSDASYVGLNQSSLTPKADKPCGPGESKIYRFFARREGTFLLSSTAADIATGLDAGQLTAGLFGSVIVEPEEAEWYRSQVTQKDLELASKPNKGQHGHPIIDYDALYLRGTTYQDLSPDGTPKPQQTPIPNDTPILKMTRVAIGHDGKPETSPTGKPVVELVHSDLTAIVTGPKRGLLPDHGGRPNPVYPDARQPYREFSIHYHDAPTVVQAFRAFNDPAGTSRLAYVLSAGRDLFAINYGLAGIGAEIWANRIKVGPMARSAEAKFEEFFLSAWVVGDPAMIVDRPANQFEPRKPQPCGSTTPENPFPTKDPDPKNPGPAATKAFYPDDPSNVYHSYLNDHVRFRINHAGGNITHVHHLHAHQWLRIPESDESLLLDSQTITPGDGFTQEIIYGSGNRNLTVGDSIFHCHFYPHFAEGMWSLWRSHDVFEAGTKLDPDGRPAEHARALPDGEIERGTPIPAIVPIPALPLAPIPATVQIVKANDPGGTFSGYKAEVLGTDNPGYPFFIPGVGGRRAPHPPLDFAVENGVTLNGGLPRHLILNAPDNEVYEKHNAFDFTKDIGSATAVELPEDGTAVEKVAMTFHEKGTHPTDTPEGGTGLFRTNGNPRLPGAPYADPAGGPYTGKDEVGKTVVYKAADIQLDVVFSKKGWHFPQQRILSLWGDVKGTLDGTLRPEPFFFRADSGDVVEYWQANLVPDVYELDDFQVRTPTDLIGQHIHLVKFDVTSSDGGANGFNYEDGTFSPDEVRERIDAINKAGGLHGPGPTPRKLTAKPIPFFGPGASIVDDKGKTVNAWDGAQATIQRWYADPITDNPSPPKKARDRTLRTVFTHDHLSPSTHQQAGLYAGLLVEPRGASWKDSANGAPLGTRDAAPYDPNTGKPTHDGGPTSWQAIIAYKDDYRERSYREFALELQDSSLAYLSDSPSKKKDYVRYDGDNPPANFLPWGWMTLDLGTDTTKAIGSPAMTLADGSTKFQPALITTGPEPGIRSVNYRSEPAAVRYQDGDGNIVKDPSHAFSSIPRGDPSLDRQPAQGVAISPGSTFKFSEPFPGAGSFDPYTPLLRAYENDDVQVRVLIGAHFVPHSFNLHGLKWLNEATDTDSGYVSTQVMSISEHFEMLFRLPPTAPKPSGQANVVDTPAADYLYLASSDTLGLDKGAWGILRAYHGKAEGLHAIPTNEAMKAPDDAAANVQKFLDDLATKGKVQKYEIYAVALATASPSAGGLVYYNRGARKLLDPDALAYVLAKDYDPITDTVLASYIPEPLVLRANAGDVIHVALHNRIRVRPGSPLIPRQRAGMHAQLVSYDVTTSDGFNAGNNSNQTGETDPSSIDYRWYAGDLKIDEKGGVTGQPVEFGAISLVPSDPFDQFQHGLFGALVIEPEDSKWQDDIDSSAQSTITLTDGRQFREFVLAIQDGGSFDPPFAATQAFNYKAEPIALRIVDPAQSSDYNQIDIANVLSDMAFVSTSDPQTPIFHAPQGLPVRFRIVHPGGTSYTPLVVHGHAWKWRPLRKGTESRVLGDDSPSLWLGCLNATPPNSQFDLLIESAGGRGRASVSAPAGIPGDYLYRAFQSGELANGLWGVFRVGQKDKDDLTVQVTQDSAGLTATGRVWKKLNAPAFATTITLLSEHGVQLAQAPINLQTGEFKLTANGVPPTGVYSLQSSEGGIARIEVRSPLPLAAPRAHLAVAPMARDNRVDDARRFLPQNMPHLTPRRQR